MDEKKPDDRESEDALLNNERRKEAARKAMLVVKKAVGSASTLDQDATCGERVASFHVDANFKTKAEDTKPYSKEAFHPSKPILCNRGKYKSRNEKNENVKIHPFYSDMVIRKTGNDVPSAKSDGNFGHRLQKSQRETKKPDASYKEGSCVGRKKATLQKTVTNKNEYSCHTDRPSIPRMKSERKNISCFGNKRSKDFKTTSPVENPEKIFYSKETVPKKEKNGKMEKNYVADFKSKTFSIPKPVEKGNKDHEKSLRIHEENNKTMKAKGAIQKDSGCIKIAKSASSCVNKGGLKSKSEKHVSARFTGNLPGRIPGTHSLIDVKKLQEKHSRCCIECLEARAKSARPTSRRVDNKEDTKKTTSRKAVAQVVVDRGATSEEHLESSIVFFRNALTAVDLLEKLFQNVGNTKNFLQHIYDGLEESSDVARCRRNLAEARLEGETVTEPKNESNKEKGAVENQEDEHKKIKTKKKEYNKTKCKINGPSRQTTESTSLKQEQNSKPKRDRDKNLLELSDEWKKRNHQGKPGI